MSSFKQWWCSSRYQDKDTHDAAGYCTEEYEAAKDAWDEQEERIREVLERLENYPTCMSCYLKYEEVVAAKGIKDKFIEILKEELLC